MKFAFSHICAGPHLCFPLAGGAASSGKVKIDPSLPPPGTGYAHWGSPLEALEGVAMTLPAVS